jgi:hypothetical protein
MHVVSAPGNLALIGSAVLTVEASLKIMGYL